MKRKGRVLNNKHKPGDDEVISKVPVRMRFQRLGVLVDASTIGEADFDGGIELCIVSNVLALRRLCSGEREGVPLLAASASQR